MPWYIYALLSAVFFASQDLLMRVLAIKTNNPRIFSVVFNGWGAFFALIIFILQRGSFSEITTVSFSNLILILSTILLYGLYERYNFQARKVVNASSLSIIYRLNTVFAFIGSIIFLHEALTASKVIGVSLIIGASLLFLYKNKHIARTRGLSIALLCAGIIGTASIIDKPASSTIQPSLYSFLLWFAGIPVIMFPNINLKQIKKEFYSGGWKVALAALLNVVGFILYIKAMFLADASRVIPVNSINSILIVLGGIVLLKEHDHIGRKIIAAIIAFVGVYLLR